jgi:hypothetical protein
MDGEVDVPEVSANEIPVACRIESKHFFGEYRHHEGRFLQACTPVDRLGLCLPERNLRNARLSFSRTAGIQQMMGYELANRWFHHEPLLKEPIWPPYERPNIEYNEAALRSGWFTQETGDRCALPNDRFGIADLSAPWQDDIEYHEATARRLAEGVLCIDGTLWRAVDEPLLFMEPVSGDPFSLMDMGWIRKSSGWSNFQPKIYGGSENKPETTLGAGELGYWNWKAFTLAVTEHQRVSEIFALMGYEGSLRRGLSSPRVDVFMPEVFGNDLAELELVRVARAMCVHLSYRIERGFNVPGLPKLVDRIISLTSEPDGVTDGAELENQMDALRGSIAENMLYIQGIDDGYSEIVDVEDMPARIEVLLENFANRPMRMPEISAGPVHIGPAL